MLNHHSRIIQTKFIFPFLGIILWVTVLPGYADPVSENQCIQCHSDYWEDMKDSVHSKQGIYCQSCHGGNEKEKDKDLAKGPGTGYLGVPDKQQIAMTCGTCHADVETMNFYGVRTDQLARYKTSMHGKKLFQENDQKVAVCADCHGYHDVVPVAEPASPVYPLNLPKTCNTCHGNEKLMSQYGLPSDIFQTYSESVHGKALFEKKDLGVANCASCHGSHGAIPPGVKEIGATCGKCHVNEKKNFLESVHAQITEKDKFSECISCHGFHGIKHPTPELYQESCSKCHASDSKAFQSGMNISDMLKRSEKGYHDAQSLVRKASIDGIFVEDEEALVEEVKSHTVEMAPTQHTLSEPRMKDLEQAVSGKVQEIEISIEKKRRGLWWRKISLIPIWIFIGILMSALWMKYKQLKDQGKNKGKN